MGEFRESDIEAIARLNYEISGAFESRDIASAYKSVAEYCKMTRYKGDSKRYVGGLWEIAESEKNFFFEDSGGTVPGRTIEGRAELFSGMEYLLSTLEKNGGYDHKSSGNLLGVYDQLRTTEADEKELTSDNIGTSAVFRKIGIALQIARKKNSPHTLNACYRMLQKVESLAVQSDIGIFGWNLLEAYLNTTSAKDIVLFWGFTHPPLLDKPIEKFVTENDIRLASRRDVAMESDNIQELAKAASDILKMVEFEGMYNIRSRDHRFEHQTNAFRLVDRGVAKLHKICREEDSPAEAAGNLDVGVEFLIFASRFNYHPRGEFDLPTSAAEVVDQITNAILTERSTHGLSEELVASINHNIQLLEEALQEIRKGRNRRLIEIVDSRLTALREVLPSKSNGEPPTREGFDPFGLRGKRQRGSERMTRVMPHRPRTIEGNSPTEQRKLRPGEEIRNNDNTYTVKAVYGGGENTVYHVTDSYGEDWCLKIAKGGARADKKVEEEAKKTRAFWKEAPKEIQEALQASYGTVTAEDGTKYLKWEWVEAESLKERIKRGVLLPEETRGIVLKIADVLSHFHQQGRVYRDMKPAHVFPIEKGRIKLIDWGLALRNESASGTYYYAAPEQLQGRPDEKSDVNALGVMIYEMLTGREQETIRAGQSEVPIYRASLEERFPGIDTISPQWRKIIENCTLSDVSKRWSLDKLKTELLQL